MQFKSSNNKNLADEWGFNQWICRVASFAVLTGFFIYFQLVVFLNNEVNVDMQKIYQRLCDITHDICY